MHIKNIFVYIFHGIVSIGTMQSEHFEQWATPHHLSDVRRGAPSWIWDYLAHDITIYV